MVGYWLNYPIDKPRWFLTKANCVCITKKNLPLGTHKYFTCYNHYTIFLISLMQVIRFSRIHTIISNVKHPLFRQQPAYNGLKHVNSTGTCKPAENSWSPQSLCLWKRTAAISAVQKDQKRYQQTYREVYFINTVVEWGITSRIFPQKEFIPPWQVFLTVLSVVVVYTSVEREWNNGWSN